MNETEKLTSNELIKEIKRIVKRRIISHVKQSEKFGIMPPKEEDLIELIHDNYKDGFACEYCHNQLKMKDEYPYLNVVSIDHKIPIALKGTNEKSNLAAVCHRCNIVKSTLTADTYQEVLKLILLHNPPLLDKLFKEIFIGRMANKLERVYGMQDEFNDR